MDYSRKRMVITNVPYSKLLKRELPAMAKEIIAVVEKHDSEVLQINEVFELLIAQSANIEKLNVRYGAHPLTMQLKPKRDKLITYVSVLRNQVNVAERLNAPDTAEAVETMKHAVKTQLGDLHASKNEVSVHEIIEEFLMELNRNPALQNASSTLGLTSLIQDISDIHIVVKGLLTERKASISQRPKEKYTEIAASVIFAIKDLFKQLDVAYLKHTEVDYVPVFDELNATLNMYRTVINIRKANNKKRADAKKKAEMEGAIDNSDETKPAPEVLNSSANGISIPDVEIMNENGLNNDPDQSLDQKKTAASSTKDLQLPQTDDDKKN